MDVLPLPAIVGLEVNRVSQAKQQNNQNSNETNYVLKPERQVLQETINFTQYCSNILVLREWLLQRHGVAFIWEYTGKIYYWQEFSIEYLEEGTKGNLSLTLLQDTNN